MSAMGEVGRDRLYRALLTQSGGRPRPVRSLQQLPRWRGEIEGDRRLESAAPFVRPW